MYFGAMVAHGTRVNERMERKSKDAETLAVGKVLKTTTVVQNGGEGKKRPPRCVPPTITACKGRRRKKRLVRKAKAPIELWRSRDPRC